MLKAKDIIKRIAKNRLEDKIGYHSFRNGAYVRSTGHFNPITEEIELESFFVNHLPDNELRIEVSYRGEIEVECEVWVEQEEEIPGAEWDFNPLTEEMEFAGHSKYTLRSNYDAVYVYPEIILAAEIIVKNREVVSWSLADVW